MGLNPQEFSLLGDKHSLGELAGVFPILFPPDQRSPIFKLLKNLHNKMRSQTTEFKTELETAKGHKNELGPMLSNFLKPHFTNAHN
jgi:hypothetical protein